MVPALSGMPHYNSDGYGSHLYVPWWIWDKHKELDFRADTTSRSAAATACPASAPSPASSTAPKATAWDEAGDSRRVRHVGRTVGAGRDDSQRAVVLRDRSGGEGSLGHSGAALPLGVERPRTEPGPAHAATFRAILEGMGGRISAAGAAGAGGAAARRPRRWAARRTAGATNRSGRSADRPAQRACGPARDRAGQQAAARTPRVRRSRAAARSSTRSGPSAWATTRRRAR